MAVRLAESIAAAEVEKARLEREQELAETRLDDPVLQEELVTLALREVRRYPDPDRVGRALDVGASIRQALDVRPEEAAEVLRSLGWFRKSGS